MLCQLRANRLPNQIRQAAPVRYNTMFCNLEIKAVPNVLGDMQ